MYCYSRLHVNIFDSAKEQFVIPPNVISLGAAVDDPALKYHADLEFHYDPRPFAFWITRRSDPNAPPLFDTRIKSLPRTPIPPVIADDSSTALDGFPLVFEDQLLQLTSALPLGTNIYGLGEVLASSGFRRDMGTDGGAGTVQAMWARDTPDPVDENVYVLQTSQREICTHVCYPVRYGSHPIYLEHRYNETTRRSQSHGVFHFRYWTCVSCMCPLAADRPFQFSQRSRF